jgi:hypothetical protein
MRASGLRTFCHISEYDDGGYRELHRLIAASDPLVLWAPSSQYLVDPGICRVSPDDFLHFVDEGMVQVVAREEWLTSVSAREGHPWPGARWNRRIDGALRRMLLDDEREPDPQRRRVAAAAKEAGKDEALRIIEEKPDVAAETIDALRNRSSEIPPGTLATAVREGDDIHDRAKVVLRDAYNHADAMATTTAETAILLGPGVFSRRVAAIYAEEMASDAGAGPALADSSSVVTAAELSGQLVDLLAKLEALGPPADLRSFMKGRGHRELIEWYRGAFHLLVGSDPRELNKQLVDHLREDMERGEFGSGSRAERVVDGVSLAIAGKGVMEGAELLVLLGLALDAYPVLKRAARKLDLADADFSPTQWPFRYLWGTGARHGRHTQVLDLLGNDRS